MAAVLRVIAGGIEPRVAFASAPEPLAQNAPDRLPPPHARFSGLRIFAAAAISIAVHGAIIAWGMQWRAEDEARAEGGSEDLLIAEGVSVVLIDSIASDASEGSEAPPEATAVTEAPPADVVAETELAAISEPLEIEPVIDAIETVPVADAPAPTATPDTLPVTNVVEAVPVADVVRAETIPDAAAPVADAIAVSKDAALASSGDAPALAPVDAAPAAPAEDAPAAAVANAMPVTPTPDAPVGAVADESSVAPVNEAAPVADTAARPVEDSDAVTAAVADAAVAAVDVPPDPPMPRLAPEYVPPPEPAPPPPATAKPRAKPAVPAPQPAARSERREASVADTPAEGPRRGEAGAGGASSAERRKADLSSYQAKLAARLRRFRTYPAEAAARELTGTAVVTFTVNAGGAVTRASLAQSSGAAILDQAALAMVKRASPFPPIPAGLGNTITVSVPVRYDAR